MKIELKHWLAYSAAIALTAGGLTNPIRAQVVVNSGFEAPAIGPGNFLTINPGQEGTVGFTGWTITAGNIDVVNTTAPILGIDWHPGSIDGSQILDLNGTTNGAIAQTFATTPGKSISSLSPMRITRSRVAVRTPRPLPSRTSLVVCPS